MNELIAQIMDPAGTDSPVSPRLEKDREPYRRLAIAEHYLQIRELERCLHTAIRDALAEAYGDDESGWWRRGIPTDIRKTCAAAREADDDGSEYDRFAYTNLMDLKKIIEAKRNKDISFNFLEGLSGGERSQLLDQLVELNRIRNTVMHPVRVDVPDDSQLLFVQEMHEKIINQ
jgi:hypothetical protein